MGALIDFFGFILAILGFIERDKLKKKRSENESEEYSVELDFGVYKYGAMSGFVGSIIAGLLLVIIILFLHRVIPGFRVESNMGNQYCGLQLLSFPVGLFFASMGKARSKQIREKFDIWHISLHDFTKLCVLVFSFWGGAFYTVLLLGWGMAFGG